MSLMTSFLKCVSGGAVRKPFFSVFTNQLRRNYSDTPKAGPNSKEVAVHNVQGTESEERVRVRRARASDVPRVLRFVREHARTAWPGLAAPPSASHLVLCDYVTRALAQGLSGFLWHSMLAEQQEARRGWGAVRGLALGTAICPWDAAVLERWARCVKCTRSRRLMHFTAHCLRAPALHDKYRVHKILQISLIVPLDIPRRSEIINVLAKNAIQRGRDVGFPLIRFDTSDTMIAESLEQLQLKKEWEVTYDSAVPDMIKNKTSEATPTNDALKENAGQATQSQTMQAQAMQSQEMQPQVMQAQEMQAQAMQAQAPRSQPKDSTADQQGSTGDDVRKLTHFIAVYTSHTKAEKAKQ